MTKNLFIFGYFGWYNAGDDAIGWGILKELSNRKQSFEITLISNNIYFENRAKLLTPDLKIKTIKFHVLSLFIELLKSDKFLFAGGTHFHDEDGFIIRRTRILIYYYLIILFAKIINKPPVILGHGIGPITKPWNKFIVKKILKISNLILVRDHDSYEFVQSCGFKEKCILGFDCSMALIESVKKNIKIQKIS